jgi:transcriptional regulator with XRE-family HTH domain
MISKRLRDRVRILRLKQRELARFAGTSRSTIAGWWSGTTIARDGDPRIVKIGAAVDLAPSECFESHEPVDVQ